MLIQCCIQIPMFIISVRPRGINKLWILGDDFVSHTCEQYFVNTYQPERYYAQCNFELKAVYYRYIPATSSQRNGENPANDNVLSRMHNALLKTMREEGAIPKILLIALEDDIIRYLNYNDYGVTAMYGKTLDYFAKTIRDMIDNFKERYLPKRAKRIDWPMIIWIPPTTHVNYKNNNLRKKFATEMANQVQTNPYMVVMNIAWNTQATSLACDLTGRLIPAGIKRF